MKEKINKMVEEIADEFIREFLKSPYNFTGERDIHGQFYHRLLSHDDGNLLSQDKPFPLLHLEYPHDNVLKGRKRGTLDLVILRPDNSSTLKGFSGGCKKDIRKLFAFEFKLNVTGEKAAKEFKKDVEKLEDCEGAKTLLFIFIRDKTYSDEENKFEPEYFKKLIEMEVPFKVKKLPDDIKI